MGLALGSMRAQIWCLDRGLATGMVVDMKKERRDGNMDGGKRSTHLVRYVKLA
jgi:hypothetical protein